MSKKRYQDRFDVIWSVLRKLQVIMKSQKEILKKLGIEKLNEMQLSANKAISNQDNVIIQSPTGTGKTLAFLLPLVNNIDISVQQVQCLIIVPSRELAIQIESVVRQMGSGIKCNSVYGGQSFNQDKINLKHIPSLIVGTPGRVVDHIKRSTFSLEYLKSFVIDEFDKSLEIGFEDELKAICSALYDVKKRILTSATKSIEIPRYVNLDKPFIINALGQGEGVMKMELIESKSKDKLGRLAEVLNTLGNDSGIVFCNYKESIRRVSDFLSEKAILHGCFYGGMEQHERELALTKFRNGSHKIIIATDLASRGLDIERINYIIHYHLPPHEHEFIHRNGRTARMDKDGTVYVLKHHSDPSPTFIPPLKPAIFKNKEFEANQDWVTVMISGGRKDRISKGDVAGFLMKQGELKNEEVGLIELKQKITFVAIEKNSSEKIISKIDGLRLKTKKIRANLV